MLTGCASGAALTNEMLKPGDKSNLLVNARHPKMLSSSLKSRQVSNIQSQMPFDNGPALKPPSETNLLTRRVSVSREPQKLEGDLCNKCM